MKIISILISSLLLTTNTCKKKQEENTVVQPEPKTEVVAEVKTEPVQSETPSTPVVKEEVKSTAQNNQTPKLEVSQVPNNQSPKITKQDNSTIAEYEALSRGLFLKIKYSNGQLLVFRDRNNLEKGAAVTLTKVQQDELNKMLLAIKPETLETLKAPTGARLYDGAAHANLSITSKGATHACPGFDHGHPPASIEKFVVKLLSYVEKNK